MQLLMHSQAFSQASAANAQQQGPLEAMLAHAHTGHRQQPPAGRIERFWPAAMHHAQCLKVKLHANHQAAAFNAFWSGALEVHRLPYVERMVLL